MPRNGLLSIIIPAYNEADNINDMLAALDKILKEHDIPAEILFIDDGSSDTTWSVLDTCIKAKGDERIRAIRFSRNFGKEAAIFAGLKEARGDCCVVMDCDLQHPPEVMAKMYRIWSENPEIEVVEARKSSRGKESRLNKGFAGLFYKLLKATSGIDLENASDFKLMDRAVVDSLNDLPERQTFFRALSSWVGYRTERIEFQVPERNAGKTKWAFHSLFRYALGSISSFSSLPMQAVTLCGIVFFVFSIILAVDTLYKKIRGISAEGFTTVILLLLIIGSIIMFSLGIIGYYISRIYEEIKFRPRYIISERIGKNQRDKQENAGNNTLSN